MVVFAMGAGHCFCGCEPGNMNLNCWDFLFQNGVVQKAVIEPIKK